MSNKGISEILEVAFEIGKFVTRSVIDGDERSWRPIVDLLPSSLKLRVEKLAQDSTTRREIEKILED